MLPAMSEYRLYFLNKTDQIVRRKEFDLPNDEEALAKAKQYIGGRAMELWTGTRLIARIDPVKK